MQVPQNRLACHSHLSSRLSQDLYRNQQWLPSTMPPQHVSRRREYLELPLCQSYPSRHALTEQVSQSWRFYVIVSMASLNALSDTFVGETMKSKKQRPLKLYIGWYGMFELWVLLFIWVCLIHGKRQESEDVTLLMLGEYVAWIVCVGWLWDKFYHVPFWRRIRYDRQAEVTKWFRIHRSIEEKWS